MGHHITQTTLSSPDTQKSLSSISDFEVQGKMGVSDGKQGGNATIRWVQHQDAYQVSLYGPLGSGSIQIRNTNGSVELIKNNGEIVSAETPEALVYQELGWKLPVNGLRYWLRGMPAPGSKPKMQYTGKGAGGELQTLAQNGWVVHYEAYQDVQGLRLPYKLTLKNGPIRLKFVFKKWSL